MRKSLVDLKFNFLFVLVFSIFIVLSIIRIFFFFFQAEDGIRDGTVTGVQTCALPISWERLMALPLRQMPLFTTLWRNIPLGAVLLGNAPLSSLPTPLKPDGTGRYATWADALTANGGSATGLNPATNTVFGVAVAGQLGTTAVGSIAVGSIAQGSIAQGSIRADSTATGSIAVGSIDLRLTNLASVPLDHVSPLASI